ncbi:MAG: hypothetical protein U0X75_02330 [Acidobacteriota bacterium]
MQTFCGLTEQGTASKNTSPTRISPHLFRWVKTPIVIVAECLIYRSVSKCFP